MIRAPSSGTSVRYASGAPKYGTPAPATILLLSPCLLLCPRSRGPPPCLTKTS
jgi:hypothetical protein